MMKRIISLFIIAFMLLTSVVCSASGLSDLKSVNAVPESFTENSLDEYVTRAEFAYMTAKILSNASFSPKATRFSDVSEENVYSGYIEFLAENGVLSGTEGSVFLPDDPVDINMANKIIVCALGFDELAKSRGGYPVGYNILAQNLKLYKTVEAKDGYLTKGGAISIIEDVMLSEVPDVNMAALNGDFATDSQTIRLFCDILGYSAYKGKITKVNYNTNVATFNVSENLYSQNKNMLTEGADYAFDADSSINFAQYEQVPATIWVDENSKVVNVIPDRNVEIKYAYIEEVNGNDNHDAGYTPRRISEILLAGEEEAYPIYGELKVKYNNVETTSAVELCGRFARLVLINEEISFIESWDIKEGGLITDVGDYDITYIQGELSGLKLKEAVFKKNLRIFIDNEAAGYKDLRINSVFDYYETDDSLVIVASEKVFTEEFKTYSAGGSFEIGNLLCMTDGKVYYSTDGILYKENQNVEKLLGRKVYAYVAPNGYIKYMSLADDTSESNSFYGIVLGVEKDRYEETAQVLLYRVNGAEIEKDIYTITERTRYLTYGLDIDALSANARSLTGDGLYKFETNGEKRITTISEPELFHGPGSTSKKIFSTDTVPDESNPNFWADSKRIYFESSAPITYIYEHEGEFCVASLKWESIRGKNADGATLRFYGGEKAEYPEFLLMCGGNNGIYKQLNSEKYGIYTGYTKTFNSEGDIYYMIRVLTPDGELKYAIDEALKNEIETDTGGSGLIKYYTDINYSGNTNEIVYSSTVLKLSGDEATWVGSHNSGLYESVIDRIVGQRVFFEDGVNYYLTPTSRFKIIVSVDEGSKTRFKPIDVKDIMPGDRVYYYFYNGEIRNIFVMR